MHKRPIHPFYRASAAASLQAYLLSEQQHPAPTRPHKITMCREKSSKNTVEGGDHQQKFTHEPNIPVNSEHRSPQGKFPYLSTILWFFLNICQDETKINSDLIQYNHIILNVLLQNEGRISFINNFRINYMEIPCISTRWNLVFLIMFLHPRGKKISLAIL